MKDRVEAVLDKIRPSLVAACAGCPMSTMTLKNGIEQILRQEIPEVKEVISA